jgi:hypothetical protein
LQDFLGIADRERLILFLEQKSVSDWFGSQGILGACSDQDSIGSAARRSNSVSICANPASPMLDLECPGSAFAGLV